MVSMSLLIKARRNNNLLLICLIHNPNPRRNQAQPRFVGFGPSMNQKHLSRHLAVSRDDDVRVLLGVEGGIVIGDPNGDVGLLEDAEG